MAKLMRKTKFLLEKADNPKELIALAETVKEELRGNMKLLQNNDFLKAMNLTTKKLYIRDIPSEQKEQVFENNESLKRDYEQLVEDIGLGKEGELSKNSNYIREVYTILTIRDQLEVHFEQESLPRTVRLLRDEVKTMELVIKELKKIHKIKDEDLKEDLKEDLDEDEEKTDIETKESETIESKKDSIHDADKFSWGQK